MLVRVNAELRSEVVRKVAQIAQAGQGAGPPNYLPAGDARVLASTPIIGGGQEVSVKFDISKLKPGGDYTYFCSFPGHFVLMNGKFIIE